VPQPTTLPRALNNNNNDDDDDADDDDDDDDDPFLMSALLSHSETNHSTKTPSSL
jgi:hypothetical protein